ncbi:uncharacterized protein CC84DRAFT_865894 [Paraphaeosphaeria sporulosa]|uniref:Uncharacterized protein n=1 Tax=Paraphaeosphaeria sporulosa TaxID=1460663 RepID=A0A177CAL3_9PLEO|nr:uncharacterized protein CC84DRAFT_865894 [Paraphaeosphaeria sporulosa]OAG03760.1 hypothetical protein CC84DRAFT_865894 [Paraphaeosphaeria sporulosa]
MLIVAKDARPARCDLTILPSARRNCREAHSSLYLDLQRYSLILCYLSLFSSLPSSLQISIAANEQGVFKESCWTAWTEQATSRLIKRFLASEADMLRG